MESKIAQLNENQMKELTKMENDLGVILIAYTKS